MPILRGVLGKVPSGPKARVRNFIANKEVGTKSDIHENVISPGVIVPWHFHETEEVIVVLEGNGECKTDVAVTTVDVCFEGQSGKHLLALSFSGFDPGCVKTCTSRECAELFSLFSSFDGDCQSGSFLIQHNRDRLSTRKPDVGVFTQSGKRGPITTNGYSGARRSGRLVPPIDGTAYGSPLSRGRR